MFSQNKKKSIRVWHKQTSSEKWPYFPKCEFYYPEAFAFVTKKSPLILRFCQRRIFQSHTWLICKYSFLTHSLLKSVKLNRNFNRKVSKTFRNFSCIFSPAREINWSRLHATGKHIFFSTLFVNNVDSISLWLKFSWNFYRCIPHKRQETIKTIKPWLQKATILSELRAYLRRNISKYWFLIHL